ncbi:hypothetical protein BLOT_007071 [Blomia tropicalis]|nr:hypothetical protein BLOT_007071 [Blomia tropicalis]
MFVNSKFDHRLRLIFPKNSIIIIWWFDSILCANMYVVLFSAIYVTTFQKEIGLYNDNFPIGLGDMNSFESNSVYGKTIVKSTKKCKTQISVKITQLYIYLLMELVPQSILIEIELLFAYWGEVTRAKL